jgi:DNA-binding transcriptional LysR family regulator
MGMDVDINTRIGRRLRLRDLHILLAVVQAGSMAKAAQQLSVSQPAVSKAISDMEHALGVRLLERSSRGVETTRYGAALARRGSAIFNELNQGVKEIEFLADPTVGELRIGATEPFAAAVVAPIVDDLLKQHPRLAFHVVTGDLSTLLVEIAARNIEFAMSRLFDEVALDNMSTEVLFHDPYVVVAGAQSPWTRRRGLKLAQLLDGPWVLPPYDTIQGRQNVAAFRASGVEPPRPAVTTLSLNLRNTLLATGRFLTVLPSFTLGLTGKNAALRALLELPATRRAVEVVRLKNRSLSPLGELFIGRMRAVAKPLGNVR